MKLPEAIYCKAKEESRRIREIMHEQGLTWHSGKLYMDDFPPSIPTSEIVFYPSEGEWNPAINHKGCKAIPAAEVIRQYKSILTPGTIVKATKTGSTKHGVYHKGRLVGFMKDGSPVVESESGALSIFDNIEPYNEKEENLERVKTLMQELGVSKEDLRWIQ